jgi:hypothetical protein
MNEKLWSDIYQLELTGSSFTTKYKDLAQKIPKYSPYWEKLAEAMNIWADLFR